MNTVGLVRDLMKVGVPTCPQNTPVVALAERLLNDDLEALVVLDAEGHAVGVVSRDDLVRAYGRGDRQALTAEQVMTENVPQAPPDIPLTAAAQIMQDMGVRVLYMMHNAEGISYPAASLSYTHLLRHLVARSQGEEIKDLGIKAERESPLATFIKRRDEAKRRTTSSDP